MMLENYDCFERSFHYIAQHTTYDTAMACLSEIFDRRPNKIAARYLLATRRQKSGEGLQLFVNELSVLARNFHLRSK